jgi:ubiquinone/menaquinone biosynthesis C-methylase UbiE
MKAKRRESVRDRWKKTPLEWDERRVARTPRTVARNWAAIAEAMRRTVRDYAASHGRVLLADVGCGNGGFADGMEESLRLYIGLDPSGRILAQRHMEPWRRYVRSTGEELALRDGVADVVVVKSVLPHCFDPERVMWESGRVLRSGGILVVSASNAQAWYRRGLRLLPWYREPSHHLVRLDEAALRRMVRGFSSCRCTHMAYFVAPRWVERWLPAPWIERMGAFSDAVGSRWMPRSGGAVVLVATKP